MFNQTLFSPSAVVPNDSYSEVNRADPIVYSSTDPGSALYIAAMDSVFQDGDEIKSYRTINPNPYKFQIDIPELQDNEGNIYYEDANYSAEGTQVSYLVNYTYGNLQGNAQDGYTFTWKSQDPGSTATAFSPELVGYDVDEFDIVLKYVSSMTFAYVQQLLSLMVMMLQLESEHLAGIPIRRISSTNIVNWFTPR